MVKNNPELPSLSDDQKERIRALIRHDYGMQVVSEGYAPYSVYLFDDIGYIPNEHGGLTGISGEELRDRNEHHSVRTDVDKAIAKAAMIGFRLGFNKGVEAEQQRSTENPVPLFIDIDKKLNAVELRKEGEHDA